MPVFILLQIEFFDVFSPSTHASDYSPKLKLKLKLKLSTCVAASRIHSVARARAAEWISSALAISSNIWVRSHAAEISRALGVAVTSDALLR